jgi:5-methylcytosine-specific restriction endonuclease McrA
MARFKPINPLGFDCVNIAMQRAIAKVKRLAKERKRSYERASANPEENRNRVANWKAQNLEWVQQRDRDYHARNREHRVAGMRAYDAEHTEEKLARQKVRRQATKTRVMENLRGRLRTFVRRKGIGKQENTAKSVGCSPSEAVDHLEQQLSPGEKLDDMDIDHIFPCDRYDFNIEGQQKKGFNYKNMQPLSPRENRQKWNKLPTKAMAAKVPRELWPDGVTEDMLPDIYPGWRTPLRM